MMQRRWYMVVTSDKYELPLSPPMRAGDLAKLLGMTKASVLCMGGREMLHPKTNTNRKRKFIGFYDDELDELERMERNGQAW